MSFDLSIVLCTYNEEKNIRQTIIKILDFFPHAEIVIVDDNSTDNTVKIIKKVNSKKIKLIVRKKIKGLASAFLVGMFNSSGKYVGWIDSNMDYVLEKFASMVDLLEKKKCDLVLLSRYANGGKDQRVLIRVVFSRILNLFCSLFLSKNIKDFSSGIFLMNRSLLLEVVPLGYGYGEFFIEFIYKIHTAGYRILEIPYTQKRDLPDNNSKTSPNLIQFFKLSVIYFFRVVTIWLRK